MHGLGRGVAQSAIAPNLDPNRQGGNYETNESQVALPHCWSMSMSELAFGEVAFSNCSRKQTSSQRFLGLFRVR